MEDDRLKNKNFLDAVKKALSGIWYGIKTQRNIKIQIVVSILVIISGILLKLKILEFIFIVFAITMVIVTEMINTAIETVVNLYTDKYHELAKIAKDVAAGAVVLAAINAIVVEILILINKFVIERMI